MGGKLDQSVSVLDGGKFTLEEPCGRINSSHDRSRAPAGGKSSP